MKRFSKRIFLFFLRPAYRAFFEGPLNDITARLQNVERVSVQLRDAEANLAAQLHNLRAEVIPYLQRAEASSTASNIAAQLRNIEVNSAVQWDGIEQLVLALLRISQPRVPERRARVDDVEGNSFFHGLDLNREHAAGNLR